MPTPMTVQDLLKVIQFLPPTTWVALKDGPLNNVQMELGANEPFILLGHTDSGETSASHN